MAKVFTKLNISSNADASSGHRYFKKLSANNSGGGGDASLITFTIEGATYQAEAGMTWEEWIASDYYRDGFSTREGYVWSGDNPITNSVGLPQNCNSQIVEGEAYCINWGGSV